MKRIIIYIIICLTIFTGCSKEQTKISTQHISETYISPEFDKLTKFFNICNSDIKKAVKVIADKKMIGVLTHLKKMDMEGRKYYLLERENLTAMIKSVTEGTYSDLILINDKGTIIYTMVNEEIFGKNIKNHFRDTALNSCYNKGSEIGFYIEDVSMFPYDNATPMLFVSYPDKINNFVRGVFIIQINIEIIEALFEKKVVIIGKDGKYKIDNNKDNILKPYPYFDKIDIANIEKIKKEKFEIENKTYNYFPFDYNSLSWIIIY